MKPPKDGTMFIGTFKNYPTPLATMWNEAEMDWAVAEPNVDLYNGVRNNWYFETESYAYEELVDWWPIETPTPDNAPQEEG
jgi:hypothetical protein